MTIYGDGPEYRAYMEQWMKDHPGPWHLCGGCGNWRMTKDPKGHCPLCPPEPREKEPKRPSWSRRGKGDDQGHSPGPYA